MTQKICAAYSGSRRRSAHSPLAAHIAAGRVKPPFALKSPVDDRKLALGAVIRRTHMSTANRITANELMYRPNRRKFLSYLSGAPALTALTGAGLLSSQTA